MSDLSQSESPKEVVDVKIPAQVYGSLLRFLGDEPYLRVEALMSMLKASARPVYQDDIDEGIRNKKFWEENNTENWPQESTDEVNTESEPGSES